MIDARVLGRNQHIEARFDTNVGSLDLKLDYSTADVHLAADEVYDLFAWLYNYHRDLLVFQMLRADLAMSMRGGNDEECSPLNNSRQRERVTVCFMCEQEKQSACELCKVFLCRAHQCEVNGYFSLRRYIMCETCSQHYQRFIGSNRL